MDVLFKHTRGEIYSGANISVVPDDIVCMKDRLNEIVHVSDANGWEKRPMAFVTVVMGNVSLTRKAALVSREAILGGTLIEINTSDDKQFQLFLDYKQQIKKQLVGAVQILA